MTKLESKLEADSLIHNGPRSLKAEDIFQMFIRMMCLVKFCFNYFNNLNKLNY